MGGALSDGCALGVPLAWFPRLLHADRAALESVEVSPFGLHWGALDEDVSVEGLLAGRGTSGRLGVWRRASPILRLRRRT